MKVIAFLTALVFPLSLLAQYDHPFSDPVPSNAHLFKLGNHTVLIHPMDLDNQAHKWICFDSTLSIIAAKKLVTPDAENIISQTYLESINSIIRVDQSLTGGQLQVSAYVFDMQGNILHRKDISGISTPGKKLQPIPFYVSQSPGKHVIALVQAQSISGDSLVVSCIAFNDQLTIVSNGGFVVPFDAELSDLYMPLVNDQKTIFILTADKFNSYKLGSVLTSYLLPTGNATPQKLQFDFDRRKIKELNFYTPGDSLLFSALFSEKKNKENIAGILNAGYDFKKQQYLPTEGYTYSGDILRSLKKMYGAEGHKGNLLNYLSVLPGLFAADAKYSYAFLQPALTWMQVAIYDQSNVYAATRRNLASNALNSNPRDLNSVFSPFRAKQKSRPKNLLFFSFKDPYPETNHRFIKINPAADPGYDFFTYFPSHNGYSALHYFSPTFEQPYLKRTTIDSTGTLIEKKIFEDKSKVLLTDYPSIVNQGSLVTFYEDKITGQTGLIMIRL